MRSPVALSSFCLRAGRLLAFGLLTIALPSLDGCQGNLDNGIKQISEGSGGDSGSGSGGSTSTGGTNGTGGSTASGGTTGSGGATASTGGAVGTGGTVSTGGTTGTGTGGMASGTGGKAGASGSGGMMAAGGRTGSGGSAGGGSGTVATCDAPTKVFKDSQVGCVDIGCHAKGAGNQTPDLQTADPTVLKAYKTTMLCMGGALVVPSNPTSSVLWKVVDGQTCGELMPKGKTSLTQDQEDCLAAWIANIK